MKNEVVLARASKKDLDEVGKLYENVKGGKFCPWNVDYPTMREAEGDLAAGCLYVLKDGARLIGACSIEPVAEDSDLPHWRERESFVEIARVAVTPNMQGRGYCTYMISSLLDEIKKSGCRCVHLLVQVDNVTAIKVYRSLGFEFLGTCHRYGSEYYACEKIL